MPTLMLVESTRMFCSPNAVESYFVNNLLEPDQQVICIGKSTGKKFDEMGVKYTLPYSPDEVGLSEAVFALDYKGRRDSSY